MKIVSDLKTIQQEIATLRASGKTLGFVPTMGALHEGHLSLVKKSKSQNDATVVSIFVNPTQFGPHEDYANYPRALAQDTKLLEPLSIDILFVPEAKDMFPPGFQTKIDVEDLSKPLCGQFRPGHFRGVTTVVLKLFHVVAPHRAYFGQKDYQQLQIVKQMVNDLNLAIEIVACPIVREPDGLALSSRNRYLSPEERKAAPVLFASLCAGKDAIEKGEHDPTKICALIARKIQEQPLASIEYIVVTDPATLQPLTTIEETCLLALAVRIGKARLIDNLLLRV